MERLPPHACQVACAGKARLSPRRPAPAFGPSFTAAPGPAAGRLRREYLARSKSKVARPTRRDAVVWAWCPTPGRARLAPCGHRDSSLYRGAQPARFGVKNALRGLLLAKYSRRRHRDLPRRALLASAGTRQRRPQGLDAPRMAPRSKNPDNRQQKGLKPLTKAPHRPKPAATPMCAPERNATTRNASACP